MTMATKATPHQIALHQEARERLIQGNQTANDKRLMAWRKRFNEAGDKK